MVEDSDRVLWVVLYLTITYIIYMCITIKSLLYSIEERVIELLKKVEQESDEE
jgi:hypothetical protein